MRLFDICTMKIYEEDGEKKVKWYKAGTLKEADSGKRYIRLFHQPAIDFFVFEKDAKKKENQEGK